MRLKLKIRFVLSMILITVGIFNFGFVVADEGCCFDPGTGFCTQNSLDSSCFDPGEWYSSDSCSVTKCELGCCVLGDTTQYSTYRTCGLLSNAQGFEFPGTFQYTDEQTCFNLGRSQTYGACIYAGEYENNCRYVMYGQCSTGDFYEDIYCSEVSLDTICNRTDETTCFKDDVHYLDSCGNVDEIKEDCDYNNGTVCSLEDGERICKDLNCEDGKANGDSWCLFEGTEYQKVSELIGEFAVDATVGSRFFRQYCLNGEVYTEPCADFRMESCIAGTCELNPWQECLAANKFTSSEGSSGEGSSSSDESLVDEEACSEEHCYIYESNDCTVILSGGGTHQGEVFCGEQRNDYAQYQPDKSKIGEQASGLMGDLHLEMCLPLIPGGLEFYPADGSFSTSTTGVCSMATIAKNTFFDHEKSNGYWHVTEKGESIVSKSGKRYGNAGLYALGEVNSTPSTITQFALGEVKSGGTWDWAAEIWLKVGDNILTQNHGPFHWFGIGNEPFPASMAIPMIYGLLSKGKIPDEKVLEILNKRCAGIGDCGLKANWIGSEAGTGIEGALACNAESGREDQILCLFEFECAQVTAPAGDESCSECGSDGLPCSEYRCRSLGKGCEYEEPTGADKGYCVKSSDHRAPAITHTLSPESPVPPFTSLNITIITDETSFCRFDIGESGNKYESMEYIVDTNWSKFHNVRLNLPGQVPNSAFSSQYSLITRDGKYEMFVRCVDTADNWNINPHVIVFEVMQTPDKIPTIIDLTSFVPYSGFPVKYNTSSKNVKFEIDYPAECRWSFDDKSYDLMEQEFECDELLSDEGTLNGYFCEGVLTGVTNDTESKTDYYIRCKDQPWLDSSNPDPGLYSRNVNTKSVLYSLRASSPLEILDLGPEGNVIITAEDSGVNLAVVTLGGGYSGRATCDWRLTGNCVNGAILAYSEFANTNARTHADSKSNLSEGDCKIYVRCEDGSGNKVNASSKFEIEEDNKAPKITKTYHFGGDLKIHTDEDAVCKYTTNPSINCGFEWDDGNSSLMQGTKLEHSASWIEGKKYYIRCKDYRNNINNGCLIIVRAY